MAMRNPLSIYMGKLIIRGSFIAKAKQILGKCLKISI